MSRRGFEASRIGREASIIGYCREQLSAGQGRTASKSRYMYSELLITTENNRN